jgi:prepilin-type N-terminal cleavage/methylation domain-containing protein
MRRGQRRRTPHGFTLIELMIAIVVSSIVVLGVFAFSQIQQTTAAIHGRDVRVQQSLEGAMWAMGRDIRAAGFGFAGKCTEVRIWSTAKNKLINPGGVDQPSSAEEDDITGLPYWVLRDGLQAQWNSTNATSWDGGAETSAHPEAAADSFDVMFGEAAYVEGQGMFALSAPIGALATEVEVTTAATLDGNNAADLLAIRQMLPPGTFFLVAAPTAGLPFQVRSQKQCALLQITGDVTKGNAAGEWKIPIASTSPIIAKTPSPAGSPARALAAISTTSTASPPSSRNFRNNPRVPT